MAESMKDYETELEASFKKIEEGDILTGTVISVDEKEVVIDLKYYAEGIIKIRFCRNCWQTERWEIFHFKCLNWTKSFNSLTKTSNYKIENHGYTHKRQNADCFFGHARYSQN